jgi:hypothetical protein
VIVSKDRLREDIGAVLEAIRQDASGRYACILDSKSILFEAPEPLPDEGVRLHRLLLEKRDELFAIPRALADGTDPPDAFAGWPGDEFLLAFVNERVALVVACPDAEAVREKTLKHLEILADRLLRLEDRFRVDRQGRGLFVGRPRLDLIVIGGQEH